MTDIAYTTIDEYLASIDAGMRPTLQKFREVIHANAPEAVERISYRMPTFYYRGNLVHFMLFKNHIGFYPGASGIEHFKEKFTSLGLKYSKGAVQFSKNQEVPWDLIAEIVQFRMNENKKK